MKLPTSIRSRLLLIGLLTTGSAVLLVAGLLIANEFFSYRDKLLEDLHVQANIIGDNSTAALTFQDRIAASETLAALKNSPDVIAAAIYGTDGRLFAGYTESGALPLPETMARGNRHHYFRDYVEVHRDIMFHGKMQGMILMRADLAPLYLRTAWYAGVALATVVIALLLAFMLLERLQRAVTIPLAKLTALVRQVSGNHDYGVRAEIDCGGEVQALGDGMDYMLEAIQRRERELAREIAMRRQAEEALRRLNETLESRISERSRELEEERNFIATVLDAEGALVVVTDNEGCIVRFNLACEQLSGVKSETALGRSMVDFCPAEEREYLDAVLKEFLSSGELVRHIREKIYWFAGDGEKRLVEWNFTCMESAGGRHLVAAGIDVTAQNLADESMRIAKETAEEANRIKSEFLANMRHEIRTPMNGILGMLDLVLDSAHPLLDEQQGFLKTAKSSTHVLLAIVNDILDFSRMDTGRLHLEIQPFSLSALLAEIMQSQAPRAEEKHLAMLLHLAPDLPDGLLGDPDRLRQIMLNLVGNAIKFTERGEISIEASVEFLAKTPAKPNNAKLHFVVRDSGIGIPAEKLESIFEAFTQADGSISRKYGGTGLGLAITRRLANLMGGRVWAESEPDQGSAFHFTAEFVLDSTDSGHPAQPGGHPHGGNESARRILLAEDNEINRTLVTALLHRRGYDVTVAHNGYEAVEISAHNNFDIILMDMQMPLMDGLTATKKIRARESDTGQHLPIVALTANVLQNDIEDCLQAGMDAHVGKPLDVDELMAVIRAFASEKK